MPRIKSHTREDIVAKALSHFWHNGYAATSMDDLVKALGISRHGIYGDFKGKKSLFISCLEAYRGDVVIPAFAPVQAPGATLDAVAAYFETQIARAETIGLPGPGCLVVNTMTELAPHDGDIAVHIAKHNDLLAEGFSNALYGSAMLTGKKLFASKQKTVALIMVTFTNGLWSMSRSTTDARELRRAARIFLSMIAKQL